MSETAPPEEQNSLVLSAAAQAAVLAQSPGGDWTAITLPHWLIAGLGLREDLPLEYSEEDPRSARLAPLVRLAEDLRRSRTPVDGLLLDWSLPDRELAVLVRGRWVENLAPFWRGAPSQPGAVFSIRDVTETARQRRRASAIGAFHGLIGQSLPMLEVYHRIHLYGPTDAALIITGETGTGKELVARALHERSRRARKSFVAVNCTALTADLFESELFGHEKGSFTGAIRQHRGRFQRADGGSLFLDEVGDMPLMTQAKMLRALEEGVVERVGSEAEERVDVRVIAATNVALEQAVAQRRFRADLFHRLSVLRIHLPALRDRRGDLPLLVAHFLEGFNRRYNRSVQRLTPEALRLLEEYHWPGNVRELRNVIERLVIENATDAIGARALASWVEERDYLMPGAWNADAIYQPAAPIVAPATAMEPIMPTSGWELPRAGGVFWGSRAPGPITPPPPPLMASPWEAQVVEAVPLPTSHRDRAAELPEPPPAELTAESIREAFRATAGNLTQASARLGVHKATLYRHLKRLGLDRDALEQESAAAAEGVTGPSGGDPEGREAHRPGS